MPPHVDLIGDCAWIGDVLADIADTLAAAGYSITPKALEECRLCLMLEASNLQDANQNLSLSKPRQDTSSTLETAKTANLLKSSLFI